MAPSTGGSLHRAFHRAESSASSTPALSPAASSVDLAMGRTDTTKSYLDIVLDAPFLTLRGTGPDVEPTSLSGHVALFLTESTSIKEITLQFRGKAKIPMPASESTTSITYVVCNHDWSFLEGDKRHSRTLKAGRHFFPFHLEIGGTLPSSIHTAALGGASVAYKLRALAVRPGLAHNLHAIAPVHILRSFTHEALEYQQTLEIENTWPEKLMYSIMLPHKAWPAGDSVLAVLKLAPLSKGVAVTSIVTSLHESTKIYARSGAQEDTRVVASARHDIVDGAAVEIDPPPQRAAAAAHSLASAGASLAATPAPSRPGSAHGHREEDGENNDIVTYIRLQIPPSSVAAPPTPPTSSTPGIVGPLVPVPGTFGWPDPVFASPPVSPGAPGEAYFGSGHAPTHAHHNTPALGSAAHILASAGGAQTLVTPTHALEPIAVAHRVRWSIFLRNRDGHASELRCSLPVVILDGRVRSEARAMSAPTRRLMLGSVGLGAAAAAAAAGDDEGAGAGFVFRPAMLLGPDGMAEEGDDEDEEATRELPSYTAHVRDRVANMFLPEAVTMRVTNPWLGRLAQAQQQQQQQHEHEPTTPATSISTTSGPPEDDPSVSASLPAHSPSTASVSTTYSAPRAASRHGSTPGTPGTPPIPGPFPPISNANSSPVPGAHHLPPVPASGARTPLDWVNSELMLSLSDAPLRRLGLVTDPPPFSSSSTSSSLPTASSVPPLGLGQGLSDPTPSPHTLTAHATILAAGMRTPPVAPQYVAAPGALASAAAGGGRWGAGASRGSSRGGSRAGSRAGSPERGVGAAGAGEVGSRGGSRPASRPGSRAASPVRGMSAGGGAGVPGYGYEPPPAPASAPTLAGSAHEPTGTHASAGRDAPHTHGHGVRNLQNLFKATMKPFTALAYHHHHHGSSSSAHAHERDAPGNAYERDHHGLLDDGPAHPHPLDVRHAHHQAHRAAHPAFAALAHAPHHPGAVRTQSTSALPNATAGSSTSSLPSALGASASGASSPGPNVFSNAFSNAPLNASFSTTPSPLTSPSTASLQALLAQPPDVSGPALLHRALTAVPDYAVAARGFIGGVPPLSSMRGLPSYAEAAAEAQRASSGTAAGVDGREREREREEREEREREDREEEEEEEEERGIEIRRAPR